MPPRRKPNKNSVTKAQEGLAAFLAMAGVDTKELNLEEQFASQPEYTPQEHPDTPMLQAEGVLMIIESRALNLMHKVCKMCKEVFMTRYRGVAYCSNYCRGKAMETQIGIRWNYQTDHYTALDAERPLVVGPEAYQNLLEMARRLVEGHQAVIQQEQEVPPKLDDDDTTPEILLPQLDVPEDQESKPEEDPFGF